MSNTLFNVTETLRTWRLRARERAQLGRLSDRTLKDIGLTRCATSFEASKPFWRA